MKRFQKVTLMALFISSIALLAGCSGPQFRSGGCVNLPGYVSCKYATLTGGDAYSVHAEEGQTIVLNYKATLSTGTLNIRVKGPGSSTMWRTSVQESARDTIELPVESSGRHTIVVEGTRMTGEFDLSWELE